MSLIRGEDDAQEAFRAQAELRVAEARVIWSAFAAPRRLRCSAAASGLPELVGAARGIELTVSAVGSVEIGFHTRAVAHAKVPMRGTVRAAPPGEWDALVSHLKARHFFEDPELDRLLVVKASSQSFAHVVLDPRVQQTVRTLAPARLELSYEEGAITLMWAGVERDHAILDDALEVLAHIASMSSETSPYR